MLKRVLFASATVLLLGIASITCGGSDEAAPPGGAGAMAGAAGASGAAGTGAASGGGGVAGTGGAAGTGGTAGTSGAAGTGAIGYGVGGITTSCKAAGAACTNAIDCCTQVCSGGVCGATQCIADNGACTASADCCGGNCAGGTCAPLSTGCKTSGNPCTSSGECCSSVCNGTTCDGRVSFCLQIGDACSSDLQCCGGVCTKATGAALGICGVPSASGAGNRTVAGQVCSGATTGTGDGGGSFDICGGDCASRSCRPYGSKGILICQPPSGCRPTGELCMADNDCCGAPGSPGSLKDGDGPAANVRCSKSSATATVGLCDNGNACSPAGAICRLAITSCNATDRCCSGTVQTHPLNCKQDILGIPRCTAGNDVACGDGGVIAPGTACASSADCCNQLPCVPNPKAADGGAPFVCGETSCVPTEGLCTTTADCCAGNLCVIDPGASTGRCGQPGNPPPPPPDGGVPEGGLPPEAGPPACAEYGQICTVAGDCCNNVPCTDGRCVVPLR